MVDGSRFTVDFVEFGFLAKRVLRGGGDLAMGRRSIVASAVPSESSMALGEETEPPPWLNELLRSGEAASIQTLASEHTGRLQCLLCDRCLPVILLTRPSGGSSPHSCAAT